MDHSGEETYRVHLGMSAVPGEFNRVDIRRYL